jgi:hypothetical protein
LVHYSGRHATAIHADFLKYVQTREKKSNTPPLYSATGEMRTAHARWAQPMPRHGNLISSHMTPMFGGSHLFVVYSRFSCTPTNPHLDWMDGCVLARAHLAVRSAAGGAAHAAPGAVRPPASTAQTSRGAQRAVSEPPWGQFWGEGPLHAWDWCTSLRWRPVPVCWHALCSTPGVCQTVTRSMYLLGKR